MPFLAVQPEKKIVKKKEKPIKKADIKFYDSDTNLEQLFFVK